MASKYSELLYTRCGDGIDIKTRELIHGGAQGGFKLFSLSENITEETADISLLNEITKKKESCSDPDFMDDAYLFITPDYGENLLVNFHPIPYDESIKDVDYPHVRGNFINQIFVGKFDDFYPYETFGDESIWNAKDKGEQYYYKTKPEPLAQVELRSSGNNISFDDIASFIKDGRKDVFKKALAFILSQFSDSLPKENRKFLVIKDENSRNLELWIAAIECAFSPKMASGLSFATRMDDFTRSNKYTVNQNNKYVPNSANQKLRLRAMIVGVDERDKSNIATVRALPNSPYVVLDGKSKTLSINIDTSQSYYNFITSFDKEKYNYFCRHFLQMINISVPSTAVFELFEACYSYLKYYNNTSSIKDLLQSLSILDKYELVKTKDFETIYSSLKENFGDILNKDVDSAFIIYKWLETKAVIMNDNSVKAELHNRICDIYLKKIIQEPYSKETQSLKDKINTPSNMETVMETVAKKLSERNLNVFKSMLDKYPIENRIEYWKSFHNLLEDLLPYYKGSFPEIIKFALSATIKDFYEAKEKPENIKDIIYTFKEYNKNQTLELLFSEIQNYKNEDEDTYIDFLIELIVSLYPKNNLIDFYEEFKINKVENYFYKVLNSKAKSIEFSEMKNFINWIKKQNEFKDYLSFVFKNLDDRLRNKLSDSEKSIDEIATLIYEKSSKDCSNSVHIYALSVINDKKKRKELKGIFEELKKCGFPTCEDKAYITKLTQSIFAKNIFNSGIDTDSFDAIVNVISCSEKYSDALVATAFNNNEDVANIVRTAYRIKSDGKENTSKSYLEDSLAKEFNNRKKDNSKKFKKFEKDIEKKIKAMKNGEIVKYFNEIIN